MSGTEKPGAFGSASMPNVAVMAARIPTGYLADRFGPRWLLVAGVATTGLAISVLLISPSFVSLLVAGLGTGLGAALLLPPILLELTKRSNVMVQEQAFVYLGETQDGG